MVDVHNPEQRSYNMSRIRNKDTAQELIVRKSLFAKGFRFRLHVKNLPGKPDIVLKKYKTVIFVNGCFWHGHKDCKYFVIPKTRTQWWLDKINKNIENDRNAIALLTHAGWRVIILWECNLKPVHVNKTLAELPVLIKGPIDELH